MKNRNIIKSFLSIVILGSMIASCSEDTMDRINYNASNPLDVAAKFILTDAIVSTAFSSVGGDMNTYLSIYIEHETGVHNQFIRAEYRNGEPSSSSTFNNVWGSMYTTLKDAKMVIKKCSEGESEGENYVTRGAAQLLTAYNLAILTDMYGDVPWKEAGDYTISMNPSIDKQEVIYQDILALVDEAITNLQKDDLSGMGTQDFLYGGDSKMWLKAAYGLKARYTMRLLFRSSNKQADMQTVLDCISKSFTSAGEQMSLKIYGGTQLNPMFGTFWARAGLGASKSMFDRIVEYGDPRIGRCFFDPNKDVVFASADDPGIKLAVNGASDEGQLIHSNSIFVAGQTAPTHLLSYHEILFLKAEALYHLDRLNEAEAALKEAVVAGFANTEVNITASLNSSLWGKIEVSTNPITPAEAAAYFDSRVAPRYNANPLKEIMIQKYIAFWGSNGESTEAYNDVRRMKALGNDFYDFKNPNRFPLRTAYGNGDTTTNPVVAEAYGDGYYVYSENVWWAGGNR